MELITPEILAAEYWKQIKKEKRRSKRKQVIFDELILKENPSPEDINRYMGYGATYTICHGCDDENKAVILVYTHEFMMRISKK